MQILLCLALAVAGEASRVDDFELQDALGTRHQLSDHQGQIVVVAFLGTECPLAKLYGPRLQQLADRHPEVVFFGINSNAQDTLAELAAYVRTHQLRYSVLKDPGNRVADQFGAERTPEVFVLDADRRIRYRGRIDDQYGVGYVREAPTSHDLEAALRDLEAGREVARPRTDAVGCHIGRTPEVDAESDVTYANQISRIMQKHCVECHRPGEIAPFSLTDYDDVSAWADTIAEVVAEDRMPPWHAKGEHGQFANARTMSRLEKDLVYRWADAGAPLGDIDKLPPPREFPEVQWRLGREPDVEVWMRERPFEVPAQGTVEYQYFVADPGFEEDTWIKAAEIVPGNRSVVHHAIVFYRAPDESQQQGIGWVTAYVPGQSLLQLEEGVARRIPAGSKLIFQMHYTPSGSVQQDRTKLGLVLADPAEVREEAITMLAINQNFEIPPNASSFPVAASLRKLPPNARLLSISPHMHVRGRTFRVEARRRSSAADPSPGAVPTDGRRELLLEVPRYDFNWQHSYLLKQPLSLEGLELHCRATFDNSENNLVNPDPSVTVRWGDQTWEEMMIAFFEVAVPRGGLAPPPTRPEFTPQQQQRARQQARRLIDRLDRNGDGVVQKSEAPNAFLVFAFNRLDRDRDGEISLEEAERETLEDQRRKRGGNGL